VELLSSELVELREQVHGRGGVPQKATFEAGSDFKSGTDCTLIPPVCNDGGIRTFRRQPQRNALLTAERHLSGDPDRVCPNLLTFFLTR